MKNGHFDVRGTLASLALPKFFFKFFGFHICERAWFWLRVAPPPAFVAPIQGLLIGVSSKKPILWLHFLLGNHLVFCNVLKICCGFVSSSFWNCESIDLASKIHQRFDNIHF